MDQQCGDILWRSFAPECVLNKLHSTPLADSLRTLYIHYERACKHGKEIHNTSFYDMGNIQCLWFNRNFRSRTKQYLFYDDWHENGIQYVRDLLNPPLPGSQLFEELVLDFDVSQHDRRRYVFPVHGFRIQIQVMLTFSILLLKAFSVLTKFPSSSSLIPFFNVTCIPEKRMEFWEILDVADGEVEDSDWDEIHVRNFKCSIYTRLCSFYFTIFHKAIAFNDFLFKINRKNSPDCDFCDKFPECIIHIFCECDFVRSI